MITVKLLKNFRVKGTNMIKILPLNARAVDILYYSLNDEEFNRIYTCKNAKEILHTLAVACEGTSPSKNLQSIY